MQIRKAIVLLFILLGISDIIYSQPDRASAMSSFTKGDYEQAYRQFRELLVKYPKDPQYKYFAAVSLINMKRDPLTAQELLTQALNGSTLKSLPDDALFYLGRARQMAGNFTEAEKAYHRYSEEAGRKKSNELGIPEYLQECRNESGKLPESAIQPVPFLQPEPVRKAIEEPEPRKQTEPDTVKKVSASDQIREIFKPENNNPEHSSVPEPVTTPAAETITKEAPKPVLPEAVEMNPGKEPGRKATELNIKPMTTESVGSFSVFEILPAPVSDTKVTIPINPDAPEGLVYRIQVGAFRNPVAIAFFKGITPIYGFRTTNITSYYAGLFRRSADAAKARAAVRSKGFKDAFVVGMVGNRAVSSERAVVLEKEWGKKPLFGVPESGNENVDTLPPTLVFRVEVTRSKQPLSAEAVDAMARVAGDRGMDVQHLNDGNIVYLIGSFITFESAEDYAGLLKRNGFRDSKVVARLGKREIDVETAKQLFDNLR